MAQLTIPIRRLDRLAMALSGLCIVHCLATAVILALLSAAGGWFGSPIIHEVGLTLAMILGAIALGRGYREHQHLLPLTIGACGLVIMAYALSLREAGNEPLFTVIGVSILALGHRLNAMAAD
jgi:hypothetical protein